MGTQKKFVWCLWVCCVVTAYVCYAEEETGDNTSDNVISVTPDGEDSTTAHSVSVQPTVTLRNLLFHPRSARHIIISDDRRVAKRRINYAFGETAALTDRTLDPGEVFEVYIDSFDHVENPRIGVTTHTPERIPYPDYMNHLSSGTWGWDVYTGQIYQDAGIIKEPYPSYRPVIKHGDTFGVSVTAAGSLHFHHNGKDLGEAASGLLRKYYAYVDLYWAGSNATIINYADFLSAPRN